ncbi:MAG: SusC/RagA family TonB-linked outer membrane protein, partial [Bacteroidales bacterium]|nr:SusC/RagA family TonB-linked outer membrane protein [Bacteroidales bacterium]
SLNLRLEYKGFDMYALFYGVQGNEIFNGLKYRSERLDNYWNYSKDALNAWTPQNTNTNIPRATREDLNGNRRVSDRFIEDGSYLRLRTLQLGYTLPQSALSFLHFDKVRVYVGGNNLFTATSYSGYDPEVFGDDVLNRGVDWGRYPLFKSFIFGLDLTF